MKHSLRLRLLFSFMLVILVTLAGVLFGVSMVFKDQVLSTRQQELINKGTELSRAVAVLEKSGNFNGINEYINQMDDLLNARIWIINKDRQLVAMSTPGMHYGMQMPMMQSHMGMGRSAMMQPFGRQLPGRQLAAVFNGKIWTGTYEHPYYGEKMLMVAIPVKSGDQIKEAVVLQTPVRSINQFLQRIYLYIGGTGLIALVLALLVVSRLTRHVVEPLKEMQKTAEAMAQGNYSTFVPVKNRDEIGRLGLALNSLAQDLAKYIAELEKTDKLRRDFVANVSHELRTPLTVIHGYNEALLDGTVDNPGLAEKYHLLIRSETERLERLIHDLLDLSRLQSAAAMNDQEKIPLEQVAASVVAMLKQQAGEKQINLSAHTAPAIPPIYGNGDRLTQLLLIILDNALKYTPADGSITVNTLRDGDRVILQVTDTGAGIPAEDLPLIWERFYKVDKSHSRTNKGTGLGLAIARQIVDLHHAQAKVESQAGQGTTFTFTFPVASPE
ncbi:Hypothetical protein LUCI_1573 [Lucifera butyrica]|uniref:histidine kinase n=1 Tax=Lucifera butyrica TaxID=1351585 RepID=A0A498R7U2_9FIRM|nr:ATP-binding protein [Lucifera butyrica]VBB06342.1 Hypothetical protein LUCI_1573 [Lucifera butyrica]